MERLTRIVCTLGPATTNAKSIKSLIDAGMDFARLNFSHGTYEEHKARIDIIKKLSAGHRKTMIIQDLPGPKIRVGSIQGKVVLRRGSVVRLLTHESGEQGTIPIMYKWLPELVCNRQQHTPVRWCDKAQGHGDTRAMACCAKLKVAGQ